MSDDHRDARAEAKAAKARAKALRPWYRKKRFIVGLGLLAIIVIAVIASAGGGGNGTDKTASDTGSTATEAPSKDATEVGLNQPARDGKFEFVVKGVECGRSSVGDEFLNKKAQGQFCLVSVSVKNIGDEAQSLFGDNQYLFDAGGKKYSADSEAAIYLEDSKTLYEEINPGNQLDGTIIFDIPTNVEPSKIELHDSAFSNGVSVTIA